MIIVTKIFRINGKRLEPVSANLQFENHAEMEAFRLEFKAAENLSEVRFMYDDTEPKKCKCGRQMVFDVVKNKYVCDCN
jgi:hypothetical protein